MSTFRRPIYVNPAPAPPPPPPASSAATPGAAAALAFHRQFPGYTASPLVALPAVAAELGVRAVYVKQESDRFGLPSFKVLGASWAIYQAVWSALGLPDGTPLDALVEHVRVEAESATPITLVAATEGNHGRAVARVAQHMSLRCRVYVPCTMHAYTRERIRSEGADVTVVNGDYDQAVQMAATAAAGLPRGILVQDTALEGYEEIPAWVVEGYATLLREADAQLHALGLQNSLVVAPVGVGSFAQAVATHYKSRETPATVVAVEPDTAPSLTCSLQRGQPASVVTSPSIMAGMNCGTVSSAAWPLLQQLVDVSVTVSDWESHCAVQELAAQSIDAGPCGAASLAAIRRLKAEEGPAVSTLFSPESVILLLSTEGSRPYEVPADVSVEEPVALTQVLTRINSSNPTLSRTQGAGEVSITNYLCAWFAHRAIEHHRIETVPGRPSVVGIVRGSGGGASLMLTGHVDTVSLATYEGDALTGHLGMKEGKEVVFGRGTLDMKGGLAAGLSALLAARARRLAGDVLVAAVADEEDASQGTKDVLAAGWRADAGVVLEPTNLAVAHAHKGFVWVEVEVLGRAAHGSQPDEGVDAILNMGLVLQALREYQAQLPVDPVLGPASLHCGVIRGGEEVSSYPASCTLTLEYRTVPAQTNEGILADLGVLLGRLGQEHPGFQYRAPRITLWRPSQHVPHDHAVVQHLVELGTGVIGRPPPVQSVPFWCDAALLTEAGIPSVVFGPSGAGLHSREEWVEVDSLRQLREVLWQLIQQFCQ
ncbi:pyridoxal-phosphate dependent enzyme-domain-containing protein [Parachaetomium inaequale]|uniref:Pyridoxal-phosphate dependent enzyme-domain-containing protein n=1 Tax=Parachaetomium inaequale TaxID=2588326 RepID=A0AAN6PPQ4_9PEZI|nr:pyridoxal-phosphate dependent enzyme-domain-containing protein [Parachaetomium inaequale]